MMKIYTYAIIDSESTVERSIKGLEEAHVYNISYRDIGAVVSELRGMARKIDKDTIFRHEGVAEKLMEKFTILPMRFNTVFNEEEGVLSMMESYYDEFKKNLERFHDKVEFGLKVLWDGDVIKDRIASALSGNGCKAAVSGGSPGRDFINRKLEENEIDKKFQEEADKHIRGVDSFFSGFVVEKKLEKLKSTKLLLSASYLVEKERQDDLKAAYERLRKTPGSLKYLFSGPWPPYNFVVLTRKNRI